MPSFFASLLSGVSGFFEMLRSTDWPTRLSHLELPALSVDLLQSIALGISLAACAGLRAWLPLFATGIAVRLGVVPLGDSFRFLGSRP